MTPIYQTHVIETRCFKGAIRRRRILPNGDKITTYEISKTEYDLLVSSLSEARLEALKFAKKLDEILKERV